MIESKHTLNIVFSLENFLKDNKIDFKKNWNEIADHGIAFYESRKLYELKLIKDGFIFKDTTKDNIIDIYNNQISLLQKISNRMNLKDLSQDNINDLTRDINYILHTPLKDILIKKYKASNYQSTEHYKLSDNTTSQKQFWEIEKFPVHYSQKDIDTCISEQSISSNIVYNYDIDNFNECNEYLITPTSSKDELKTEETFLKKTLDNFIIEIDKLIKTNLKQNPENNSLNENTIKSIIEEQFLKLSKINNELTSGLINKLEQNLETILIKLDQSSKPCSDNNKNQELDNLKEFITKFQKDLHNSFTKYLEDTIIKQGTDAYKAAQVLEDVSIKLSDQIIMLENKLDSTFTDDNFTNTSKTRSNIKLSGLLFSFGLFGLICIWAGKFINDYELSSYKAEINNTCNIINSKDPPLRQNLMDTLKIQCN